MMRRTPLARKTPLRARSLLKPSLRAKVGKKVSAFKTIKTSKVAPNAEERAWMDFVANFGCVVCWLERHVKTPCAVHHIVEGGRRLGHKWTIGLCDPGHHQNTPTVEKISRHPNKKQFEAAYGTEYELHAYLVEQHKRGMHA